MVIGGAESSDAPRTVLASFVELAGSTEARIVIVSSASEAPALAEASYCASFEALGVKDARALSPRSRSEADAPDGVAICEAATGIFLSGGAQLRLTSIIGGSAPHTALRDAPGRGVAIAGTSAGAAALSEHMVAYGRSGLEPVHGLGQMAAGLGILPGVLVDQHFSARARLGRLLALCAESPWLLGLGVDEDTAAVLDSSAKLLAFDVIGTGTVTVIDCRHALVSPGEADHDIPVTCSGESVTVVRSGERFELAK